MNAILSFRLIPPLLCLAGLPLVSSCRKDVSETEKPQAAKIPAELQNNGLNDLTSAVYRSQRESKIHWQPWTPETLEHAKSANRMILAVIAMPQQPGFQSVIAKMEEDAIMVQTLNNEYVPVLIDGDASREMGLLTADLCAEINRGLQLPLFLWLSPEANPVAWIPVPASRLDSLNELFNQSHSMVMRIWKDDPAYISKNSALDNANRRERISARRNAKIASEQPHVDVIRAIRQLTSLYDPLSRSFDEAGGLFPAGALDLLAMAAVHPGLPDEFRSRCLETTHELSNDLLGSAMFDPLDGGMYSSRRGASWSFPVFHRDAISQARATFTLLRIHRATGDERVLEKALGLIAFAEKSYLTSEGLFSVGMTAEADPMDWLWRVEDVEKALSKEDAAWWISATGMKGLGNLPSESDPQREFFRGNSIAISKPLHELAAMTSESPEAFASRYEAVRKTLLRLREERIGNSNRDDISHAGATFRMVSAYAAAFTATGDESHREKAVSLLKKARQAFSNGRYLRLFSRDTPHAIGDGRAFLYALAMQSTLDVTDITSDQSWLNWSDDLATTMTELFAGGQFLKECPDRARIIDLPVTDLVMLFDDSSGGLVSFAECRLAARQRPLIQALSSLATPLPTSALDRPILHTDLLQATLSRHYPVVVVLGENPSPELLKAVERLPLRSVHRRTAGPNEEIPAGSCKVLTTGGEDSFVRDVQSLHEAVLPFAEKR